MKLQNPMQGEREVDCLRRRRRNLLRLIEHVQSNYDKMGFYITGSKKQIEEIDKRLKVLGEDGST